ncbi:MAG TPA: DUF58 domain-containing protein [Chloroflexia bacterium]|nr:DUF58 domain-containing protein [Chloroflexia bacterium]
MLSQDFRLRTTWAVPTPRLIGIALGAAPLIALQAVAPGFLALAGLYILGVIGAALVDWRQSPAPGRFRLERLSESKLSLGAENPITIRLQDPRPAGPAVRFLVRDTPPGDFRASALTLGGRIGPRQELRPQYTVYPPHRGDFAFGDLYLRVWTAWGLLTRQARHPQAAAVKVYPNLLDVRRYEMLARRGQLFELGLKNARRLGSGTEFERLRDYVPGDDYRQMAWAATARRGKPIVIEYETERSQPILLLLDAGRLMSAPVGDLAKLDYAINTCLLLTFVATIKGDRVGLLVFADKVLSYYPPRRGRAQFLSLLEALYNVQAQPVESDYAAATQYLTQRHPRRSLTILFTDVLDRASASGLIPPIARLAPRYLPLVVAVGDPTVSQSATAVPDRSAQLYARAVARQLLNDRHETLEALAARGVLTVDVPAGDLSVAVINRYLELKARGQL